VVFHALDHAEIKEIAVLLLKKLALRFKENSGGTLVWDETALDYLARRGYQPAYGARPLKRVIQQEVETALSRQIVRGAIKPGDQVTITAKSGALLLQAG